MTTPTGVPATVTVTAVPGGVPLPVAVAGVPATISVFATADGSVDAYNLDRSNDVLALAYEDPLAATIAQLPGSLKVRVGNGIASSTAYFYLDGAGPPVSSVVLDVDGTVTGVSVPVAGGAVSTTRTLSVGTSDTTPPTVYTSATATNQLTFAVLSADPTGVTITKYFPPTLTVTRWTFQQYDFVSGSTPASYTFATNPISVELVEPTASLTHEATTNVSGQIKAWEGASTVQRMTVRGRVLTKTDYDALIYWANVNQRIWLTNEFSERSLIAIISLEMTRKRDADRPWHHTYTLGFAVLDDGLGAP